MLLMLLMMLLTFHSSRARLRANNNEDRNPRGKHLLQSQEMTSFQTLSWVERKLQSDDDALADLQRHQSGETLDSIKDIDVEVVVQPIEGTYPTGPELENNRHGHLYFPGERTVYTNIFVATPSVFPTSQATAPPSEVPTLISSGTPSNSPSSAAPTTLRPSDLPSIGPDTSLPSVIPSNAPYTTPVAELETRSPSESSQLPTATVPTNLPSIPPSNSPSSSSFTLEEFLEKELGAEIAVQDGSPQRAALLALERSNPDFDPNIDDDDNRKHAILQQYALNVLYFVTGGPLWSMTDGWTSDQDPCTWYGITCDTNSTSNNNQNDTTTTLSKTRIVAIELADNGLISSNGLPSEFRVFSDLSTLDMGNNYLQGTLPTILAYLTSLDTIELSDNFFSSPAFPSEWESLTNLRNLNLRLNTFTGSLPTHIGSLVSLR